MVLLAMSGAISFEFKKNIETFGTLILFFYLCQQKQFY